MRNKPYFSHSEIPTPKCLEKSCSEKSKVKGYCRFHYVRVRRGVDPGRPKGIRGKLNPRWTGGNSEYRNHYELKIAREVVLEREGHKCQVCGGEAAQTHHIDKNKSHHDPDNLFALCIRCHKGIFHTGPRSTSKWIRMCGRTLKELSKETGRSMGTIIRYAKDGRVTKILESLPARPPSV